MFINWELMFAGLLHFQSFLEMQADKMNKFLCVNSSDVLFESFLI